jgi:hypothetical protein
VEQGVALLGGRRRKGVVKVLELGLVNGDTSSGKGVELAVQMHLAGKILEDWDSLDVEVPKHGIPLPASK